METWRGIVQQGFLQVERDSMSDTVKHIQTQAYRITDNQLTEVTDFCHYLDSLLASPPP